MRPELIEATRLIQAGDPGSMEAALQCLQGTVYAFSMKVCGHVEDAEDTMQEVLLKSLPHLGRIGDPNAMAVWLYTVTKNRCWRSRRRSVYAPREFMSLDDLMPERSELASLLQSAESDPEGKLLESERNERLEAAILELPTPYRLVLVLHDVEGLQTEQVAAVLRIQAGTVRVRLHRARLFVRRALGPKSAAEKPSKGAKAKADEGTPVRRRPIACKEVFANLSEYLDDRLPVASCEHLQKHMEACPACVAFIGDLRKAIDQCRQLQGTGDAQTPPDLRSLLTKEYRRMMAMGR